MSADDAALQELLHKQACQEVLTRYARALDWVDEEALKTVFLPTRKSITAFLKAVETCLFRK